MSNFKRNSFPVAHFFLEKLAKKSSLSSRSTILELSTKPTWVENCKRVTWKWRVVHNRKKTCSTCSIEKCVPFRDSTHTYPFARCTYHYFRWPRIPSSVETGVGTFFLKMEHTKGKSYNFLFIIIFFWTLASCITFQFFEQEERARADKKHESDVEKKDINWYYGALTCGSCSVFSLK